MTAYYNEIDPFAADWLENLIREGLIAPGDVDRRSIKEVDPIDLVGYTQAHFFAGIGGWSLALRLAGWPDDRPVWTGSCPCQPFSAAGKRQGTDDPRHLWPEFNRIIGKCRPPAVLGEQVASKDGRLWLAGVRADLETLGYAVGAADLCAAGVGAPHIRQRLYWLANAEGRRQQQRNVGDETGAERETSGREPQPAEGGRRDDAANGGLCGGLADAECLGRKMAVQQPSGRASTGGIWQADVGGSSCTTGGLGHADDAGPQGRAVLSERTGERAAGPPGVGCWGNHWIECADGKARRVEPGIFPLVDAGSVRNRVGLLRGSGNAIVPALAAEFIGAFMDTECHR